jgi:AraC family transcriptional activator FtrA
MGTVLSTPPHTVATSPAGINVPLHLVRHDHDADVATRLSRRTVVASHHEGGRARFAERPVGKVPSGDPTSNAVRSAPDDLHRRRSVAELASSTAHS